MFARVLTKYVVNGDYSFYIRNGDRLSLLIKTGNTHKRSMISQAVIRIYKLVGGNKVKNNRGVKIVVVLTITVTKYLMKGLFDNLVRPLLLLFCICDCECFDCAVFFNLAIARKQTMPSSEVVHPISIGAYQAVLEQKHLL